MNVLFGCQARSLDMFYGLTQAMGAQGAAVDPAYYVADALHFGEFARRNPVVLESPLLREWELVNAGLRRTASPDVLTRLETDYGDPTLWNTVLSDRRLVYGSLCTLRQDYRRRFSDEQLLSVAQHGYEQLEAFFDRVRPDAVITFICVTFGEYMLHQIARRRGVPFLNLRPTRVGNLVTYGRSIFEPSEDVRAEYDRRRAVRQPDAITGEAQQYLAFVREKHARYEGVVVPGESPATQRVADGRLSRVARTLTDYFTGPARHDNHVPNPLATLWYTRVANPRRASGNARYLGASYVRSAELPTCRYALFPLHYEPEVSLLVYGRPYVNQIEVVRAAARSLPAGMVLLVKEHPVALKNRPRSYYDALLRVPNVRLLDPGCSSRDAVLHSQLVITIAGSMGQEAAILRKPVVLLGHTSYEMLPVSMVAHAGLQDLPDVAARMLGSARHDEDALVDFIAAVMSQSVRANLYSELLGRGGSSGGAVAGYAPTESMTALARFTIDRLGGRRGD